MKKQIYFLLVAIIGLVCYTIFRNAKTHVEAVEVVEELAVKTDSLNNTVIVLNKEKDSVISEIIHLDSALTTSNMLITKQNADISSLKKDTAALKKVTSSVIIIHDTVYITETKNFWGKKKKSVEVTSGADTVINEIEIDTTETE
jgi:DMSO reductase anchor subunit